MSKQIAQDGQITSLLFLDQQRHLLVCFTALFKTATVSCPSLPAIFKCLYLYIDVLQSISRSIDPAL